MDFKSPPASLKSTDFLAGGGQMGAAMRAFDWAASPLGDPSGWPLSLRITIRLVLNNPHPMFIWWGPDFIQFYNDAYSVTMGPERHPGALGVEGQVCWQEIWHIIGPQIDHVMQGRGSTWDEDRLVPMTRNGQKEDVWWTYGYGPIEVEDGVGGVLVVCQDVTAQHLTMETLSERARFLDGLFEQAPSFMAVLQGPDHVFELTNAAYRRIVGDRDLVGKPVKEVIPEASGQGFLELLDHVYRTGEAHVGLRVPLTIAGSAPNPDRHMLLDFIYAPIFDNGRVTGVFVEGTDVTQHVHAEDHLRLINEELQHRVKNTLTVVGAMATQTLRGTAHDGALKTYLDRLAAFARAHDSLTSLHWTAASVRNVVEGALSPHRTGKGMFSIDGPDLTIPAKQALSLALAVHELATNAIKYGALSVDAGRITIFWDLSAEPDAKFHFEWAETNGPTVAPPTRKGFGSKLINRVLKEDFGGVVEVLYRPEGLLFRMQAPMSNGSVTEPFLGGLKYP
jgi:two-component sensor histidine kinase